MQDEEDSPTAPSAYVSIILNAQTIFRTRSKALSNQPFFNAGTERFIRDWRRTLVMLVVRDRRLREADPILGVVPLKISELFTESSQVTQFFPLAGGVGRGRIRVSILFRPVLGMSRQKSLLGWDIGTVQIHSNLLATGFEDGAATGKELHLTSIRARTLAGSIKISGRHARWASGASDSKDQVEWRIPHEQKPIGVPVRRRFAAPFVIEFRSVNAFGKKKVTAMCIVWLQDVADDEVVLKHLPIWHADQGFHRLLQNYHNFRNEHEAEELGAKRIGYLRLKIRFKSGLGDAHVRFDRNPDSRAVMEAWQLAVACGLSDQLGDLDDDPNGEISGERSSKSTDRERERRSEASSSTSRDDEGGSSSESESEDDEKDADRRRILRDVPPGTEQPSNSDSESDTLSEGEGGAGRGGEEDDDQPGLFGKLHKWKEERKELHRQHRGLKQFKTVRTASWLKQSAVSSASRALHRFDLGDRRTNNIETEL